MDQNLITSRRCFAALHNNPWDRRNRDPFYAQDFQLLCEYDPHPPFNAGSARTAPPAAVQGLQSMFAGFADAARTIGRQHG